MPSSTSSSDSLSSATIRRISSRLVEKPDRPMPPQAWTRILALMALVSLMLVGAWEATARTWGYGPNYNDTPLLWGMERDRLKTLGDDAVVIVGSSRIRFDLSHEVVSEAFGGAPVVNLAMNGSVGRPVLSDLARDPSFTGTVICDHTAPLFWAPGGPNMVTTMEWLDKYPKRTPAERAGQWLALGPESVFAFLQKDDLALSPLVRGAMSRLPNRAGVHLPPEMPPYIHVVHPHRRETMWKKLETDTAFQQRIQGIWKVLFSFARPLPPELLAQLRAGVAADVAAIRARGGEVIFVECPSTGWLRSFENENFPRELYWEPLLAETGCVGVHFEDYPELSGFECPEWSHLKEADADAFSKSLVGILKQIGVAKPRR